MNIPEWYIVWGERLRPFNTVVCWTVCWLATQWELLRRGPEGCEIVVSMWIWRDSGFSYMEVTKGKSWM